jgi:3-isopropylmalate/(R)-2-methylmalate dehydratase small subunit
LNGSPRPAPRNLASARPRLVIDLQAQEIRGPEGGVDRFEIDPFRKECLLAGTDDISFTLRHLEQIAAFENAYETRVRWI